jgi:hypothetical protein
MTVEKFVEGIAHRPLCLRCLATLTAPLTQAEGLELLTYEGECQVALCVACKDDARMTYRFDHARPDLAA